MLCATSVASGATKVTTVKKKENKRNAYDLKCESCGNTGHEKSRCWALTKCGVCKKTGHPTERCIYHPKKHLYL